MKNYKQLTLLLFIGLAFAEDKYVAVFNLENNGLEDNQVRTIKNRLESELQKAGLKVVERDQINDIFKEQKLQLSGVVDDSLGIEVGALLGATHILKGSVGKIDEAYFTISVKLVDVGTGELIKTADYDAYDGLTDLIKNGTTEIANSLFEIEKGFQEPSQYIIEIGNINISNDDFNISRFGNPLNIGLVIWEDQKQIFKKSLGKVRGLQGINERLPLKLKVNSVYKLYIGETDGIITSNAVYEWVATWKGGRVEQRTKDWFFDKEQIKVGRNSYLEIKQKPKYSDLKAELFMDTNFKGKYLPVGVNISKLGNKKYYVTIYGIFGEERRARNWNDELSSVKVNDGYEIIIFEHSDYDGDSLIIRKNYPNLKDSQWNDKASSVKIRKISN